MLPEKEWDEWVTLYERSHQHPFNRLCHLVGIPLIALSVPLLLVIPLRPGIWPVPLIMFIVGWLFQFAGHMIEGKRPEFFHDWRFLFVGLRWWFVKIRGK
ncbi:MAG TPA: Mpo1-like protein [Gammaproteobacteria bacterium]|nr:Mpo1-like protein [Gammaproteobacteria bacterium]